MCTDEVTFIISNLITFLTNKTTKKMSKIARALMTYAMTVIIPHFHGLNRVSSNSVFNGKLMQGQERHSVSALCPRHHPSNRSKDAINYSHGSILVDLTSRKEGTGGGKISTDIVANWFHFDWPRKRWPDVIRPQPWCALIIYVFRLRNYVMEWLLMNHI